MLCSKQAVRNLIIVLMISGVSACSFKKRDGAPRRSVDVSGIDEPTPRHEPRSKYGNPRSYTVLGKTYYLRDSRYNYKERGIASWYGTQFHGNRTSSGETYSMYEMTAAHKTLPIPAYVEVTNLNNGRKIIVRVNDRGPFHPGRIIDLSYVAAKKLGIVDTGTAMVEVRSIDPRNWNRDAYEQTRQTTPARRTVPENSQLYVQAGAFSSKHNAEAFQQQLNDLLPSASIQLVYTQHDKLYRVRIGPVSGIEHADIIAQKIAENGYPSPHVVIE